MKFFSSNTVLFIATLIGAANATPASAPIAARAADSATFVSSWNEAGLQRYRFYTNVADKNRFVHAFQNCGGITNNWQAWDENGHGVFDDSEVVGALGAKVIACGIHAVTGQSCHEISEIGC
ncbi:hypothetical protein CPB83DRAFT_849592 [Crepidotus variabilis]|uniref:Uncharacterized protein n=1 Tax=Crepidotus variabilis TaxID=179855 RepID=A0A9P6JRU5_9AGAR|nr:hypothetical protein CPB83DRAFT_849592 [Crepidotus variabilis]